LHRPNVSLEWDAIEAIVKDGIKLKTGVFIPLDVIIFGTGYSLVCIHMNREFLAIHHSSFVKELASLNVQGSNGNTILEYFESKGGAQAYLGSCFPGFPNLFTLLGKLLIFFRAGWIV
jgi:cation diffusion facilitator CzcD-associated flavoprotein CzcO